MFPASIRSLSLKADDVSFKTIFGGTLRRRFDNQAVELFLKCAALNRMSQLGKPATYKVEN